MPFKRCPQGIKRVSSSYEEHTHGKPPCPGMSATVCLVYRVEKQPMMRIMFRSPSLHRPV